MKIIFVVFCLLVVEQTARAVTFQPSEITALRNYLRRSDGNSRRETDPAKGLIQGKFGPGPKDTIDLAKHHIIPEHEIRAGLRHLNGKVKNDGVLKAKLEKYFNDPKNVDSLALYNQELGDLTGADDVMNAITRVVSWNPNNLRAGPSGAQRHKDPEEGFDEALATADQKRFYEDSSIDILDKLTLMHSSSNPTWQKVKSGKVDERKWKVLEKHGAPYTTSQLLIPHPTPEPGSERYFYINTGEVLSS